MEPLLWSFYAVCEMEICDISVCLILQNCNKHTAHVYFEAGLSEQPETTISVSVFGFGGVLVVYKVSF